MQNQKKPDINQKSQGDAQSTKKEKAFKKEQNRKKETNQNPDEVKYRINFKNNLYNSILFH